MSLSLKKEKFVVIGSNSFSGSHFVNCLLNNGYKVWGISRSNQPNKVFLPYFWNNKNGTILKENCENFIFSSFDEHYNLLVQSKTNFNSANRSYFFVWIFKSLPSQTFHGLLCTINRTECLYSHMVSWC